MLVLPYVFGGIHLVKSLGAGLLCVERCLIPDRQTLLGVGLSALF